MRRSHHPPTSLATRLGFLGLRGGLGSLLKRVPPVRPASLWSKRVPCAARAIASCLSLRPSGDVMPGLFPNGLRDIEKSPLVEF